MQLPPETYRLTEDLTPVEVQILRRVAFLVAGEYAAFHPSGALPTLESLDACILNHCSRTFLDRTAFRYAVAQAMAFVAESGRPPYVPSHPLDDDPWLEAVMEGFGYSDSELALALRLPAEYALHEIAKARTRLGFAPNPGDDLADTIHRVAQASPENLSPSCLLDDGDWLSRRTQELSMSDGEIAREIVLAGIPCDRSTVRSHRRRMGLQGGGTVR